MTSGQAGVDDSDDSVKFTEHMSGRHPTVIGDEDGYVMSGRHKASFTNDNNQMLQETLPSDLP